MKATGIVRRVDDLGRIVIPIPEIVFPSTEQQPLKRLFLYFDCT